VLCPQAGAQRGGPQPLRDRRPSLQRARNAPVCGGHALAGLRRLDAATTGTGRGAIVCHLYLSTARHRRRRRSAAAIRRLCAAYHGSVLGLGCMGLDFTVRFPGATGGPATYWSAAGGARGGGAAASDTRVSRKSESPPEGVLPGRPRPGKGVAEAARLALGKLSGWRTGATGFGWSKRLARTGWG
jgi:hypothetical protein